MGKRTTRVRRTFTPQFKRDAVNLVQAGKTVTEVARAAFEDPSLRTNPRMPLLGELVELLRAAYRGR